MFAFFIAGGVPGLSRTTAGFCIATGSADLLDDEEMKAALATRKGWMAAVGLAIRVLVSWSMAAVSFRVVCTAQRHGRSLSGSGEHRHGI